ncbi:hypothetical protein EDB85DRAFT_1899224 [Lactarius pseudohatsudake]|nr:hypothetical protein EDB85DRAFT_1899224 [Lactarius pseudohatsudake]
MGSHCLVRRRLQRRVPGRGYYDATAVGVNDKGKVKGGKLNGRWSQNALWDSSTTQPRQLRVQRHLPPEDVEGLLQRYFQIINLWRPIHHAAYDWPLALCDCNSIDQSHDLVWRRTP